MLIEAALQQSEIDLTEAEIILSHLLKRDRSFVKAFPNFRLKTGHATKLKEFVKRRAQSEPLAYILGYKEFCGLKIYVDKRVMVPRPETEDLVTEVIKQVYSIPNRNRKNHWKHDQLTIVDVGTGSGNIAIALAKAVPFAKIFATEIDNDAYNVAKQNISHHGLSKKISLLKGDLLESVTEKADFIVANLPYIPTTRLKKLQPEVSRWEPTIALDGGRDGLKIYRKLFDRAASVLKPNGLLFYEIDGDTFVKNY
ncbi:MAG: peptide chain release factor N(5)-glutamine methyltransferase [Candidatus Woykebacteria bacterium]